VVSRIFTLVIRDGRFTEKKACLIGNLTDRIARRGVR